MKHPYLRIFIVALFLLPAFALAQFGLPQGFDIKAFQKNEESAMYFVKYDSIWQSVSASPGFMGGKDYVCYPDKKGWKVVAGTVDSAGFKKDAVFYTVDSKNVVTLQKKKFDTLLVASMGRALFNSGKALEKLNIKSPGGWRKFVRQNADQTLAVWAFCDEDDGTIYYGPELSWYYTANGNQLTTSKIVNKAPVAAVKTGQSLTFSLPTDKMPSVGTIWLAHRYKATFSEINVNYKTGSSTYRYNATEKTYSWEHTAN